jgi:hypothetical protein
MCPILAKDFSGVAVHRRAGFLVPPQLMESCLVIKMFLLSACAVGTIVIARRGSVDPAAFVQLAGCRL